MSAEWPDLSKIRGYVFKYYFQTANLGCPLCRMVVAILRDAREKQCITEPKGWRCCAETIEFS